MFERNPMTALTSLSLRIARPLLAAALLASSALSAQAANYTFSGISDFGPLVGESYSGSFSFADQAAGYTGDVELDSFTLVFNGYSYTLASADFTPTANFFDGSFIGVTYVDEDGDLAEREHVYLSAGFSVDEAFLSYTTADGSIGFGSLVFVAAPVPEPASLALMLGGLALLGGVARRRPR